MYGVYVGQVCGLVLCWVVGVVSMFGGEHFLFVRVAMSVYRFFEGEKGLVICGLPVKGFVLCVNVGEGYVVCVVCVA